MSPAHITAFFITARKYLPFLGIGILLACVARVSPAAAGNLALQAEQTPTATEAPEVTGTPEASPTAVPVAPAYLPLIFFGYDQEPVAYIPTTTSLYCNPNRVAIPDNTAGGVASEISITDPRFIGDLDIWVDISHSWVGDLVISLTHQDSGTTAILVDRPGIPNSAKGCGSDNLIAVLDDEITLPIESRCATSPAGISGVYLPGTPLSAFDLKKISGTWTLTVSDNHLLDSGRLNNWCLNAKISESPAPALPPPLPVELPAQTRIHGITGQDQALPLDCESRSAVDWAGYFGVHIDELKFFNQLPVSDNPDKGFVGDVHGRWGQIPPHPYGVHAEPVANLLRAYGLPAYAHRPLSWDALRVEIAAGRPVFVWITGAVTNGIPQYYTPADWLHTLVARYQHTVLVIGYSQSNVTILDGDSVYTRSLDQFLESWSVLGNMAITASP